MNVIHGELHDTFSDLIDSFGENLDENSLFIIQADGYHRAIFINLGATDYLSVPTHILERSNDNMSALLIDE